LAKAGQNIGIPADIGASSEKIVCENTGSIVSRNIASPVQINNENIPLSSTNS